MPRRPRISMSDVPMHVIQRGNNKQACFYSNEDYITYMVWLEEYAKEAGCQIHAYVLMTNHVHLLLTPKQDNSLAHMMKALGQRYVQYINRTYQRSGTLWEGRFRSSLVNADDYLFACMRYIELNPVRAKMVKHPADYLWSSYRCNAQGEINTMIQPHPLLLQLGLDSSAQQKAYRALFQAHDPQIADQIRQATNGNFVLGNTRFVQQITEALGRRVTPAASGRPPKKKTPHQ